MTLRKIHTRYFDSIISTSILLVINKIGSLFGKFILLNSLISFKYRCDSYTRISDIITYIFFRLTNFGLSENTLEMQIGHMKLKLLMRIHLIDKLVVEHLGENRSGRSIRAMPRNRGNGLTSVLFLLEAVNSGILALTRCRIGPGVRVRFSQWPFGKWCSVLRCERI